MPALRGRGSIGSSSIGSKPASSSSSSSCGGGGGGSSAPGWMIVAAFLILAVLAGVLVYVALKRSAMPPWVSNNNNNTKPPQEGFFSAGDAGLPKQQLVFLYMTGCGWCDRFKPQWAAFEDQYGETLERRGITLHAFERSEPAAQRYLAHVDGYPTVLLISDGGARVRKFEGDRTPEGLMSFVNEHSLPLSEGFFADDNDREPRTEFESINRSIQKTRDGQRNKYDDQRNNMQSGAGGSLS